MSILFIVPASRLLVLHCFHFFVSLWKCLALAILVIAVHHLLFFNILLLVLGGRELGLLVRQLLELRNEESIHVVDVRVEAPGEGHGRMEPVLPIPREARLAMIQSRVHELHVTTLEGVVHNRFVLKDRHGASAVDDDAPGLALRTHRVYRSEEQLLLQMRCALDVLSRSRELHRLIPADDARPRAWSVKQCPIEARHDRGHLPAIIHSHDRVPHPKPLQVRRRRFLSRSAQVIGEDDTVILHQLCAVRRLSPRGATHVHDPLPRLRSQRHDRAHGRGRLQHVVPSQVLGRGANRYARLRDLQPHFRPAGQRFQHDASLDQRPRQLLPPGLQRVAPDDHRAGPVTRLEELHSLRHAELAHEQLAELRQVPKVLRDVSLQLLHILAATPTRFRTRSKVRQHVDDVVDALSKLFGRQRGAIFGVPGLFLELCRSRQVKVRLIGLDGGSSELRVCLFRLLRLSGVYLARLALERKQLVLLVIAGAPEEPILGVLSFEIHFIL
mmetsp:Transcript_15759/g.59978  ORF Transcript_15759/g.59978 Transcript_15759/m.59978 type:complete len:499 (+) Transcript_15759:1777-3273(+)